MITASYWGTQDNLLATSRTFVVGDTYTYTSFRELVQSANANLGLTINIYSQWLVYYNDDAISVDHSNLLEYVVPSDVNTKALVGDHVFTLHYSDPSQDCCSLS